MNEAILPAETQAEEPAVYSDGTDIIDVTDALINIIEEYSDDEGWILHLIWQVSCHVASTISILVISVLRNSCPSLNR